MTNEIETVAVIGAGECGREMAFAALLAGYRVILEDVSENRLAQAADWIARVDHDTRLRLVLAGTVEEAVREADLIVEAVAEEMEMKIEMFTIFDKFAKPDAIFASSASSISIAELAAVTFCPDRCIGMRLISAAGHAEVLELVRTPDTSEETVARCTSIGQRMGREIVITRDIGTCRALRGSEQLSASSTTVTNSHRADAASEKRKRGSPQRTQRPQRRIGAAPSLEGASAASAEDRHELPEISRTEGDA